MKRFYNWFKTFNNWFNNKWGWFFTNGNKSQQENNIDTYLVDMDAIYLALYNAKRLNLEIEVVFEALKCMQQNPNLTISEAITLGYKNWVK